MHRYPHPDSRSHEARNSFILYLRVKCHLLSLRTLLYRRQSNKIMCLIPRAVRILPALHTRDHASLKACDCRFLGETEVRVEPRSDLPQLLGRVPQDVAEASIQLYIGQPADSPAH